MPKIVDHAERRREVLDATWRVIGREGLEAATVRRIAAYHPSEKVRQLMKGNRDGQQ